MEQIQRTALVLERFAEQNVWGARELAAALGLPRSGVHRALQSLVGTGWLRMTADQRYEVGPGLVQICSRLLASVDLTTIARDHLNAASEACGETVILTVYDPTRRRFAAVTAAESSKPVRYIWQALRDWSELHLGASGRGILAFLPPAEQREVLDALPANIGGPQPTSKAALRRDLESIRTRGWAQSAGNRFPGARGVCAPIRVVDGPVIGSVVIGWPDQPGAGDRVVELGSLCKATADAITRDLGAG